jgi:hypothetical protein
MNNPREALNVVELNISVTHTRGGTITKGFNVEGDRATYFIECDGHTIVRTTHDVVDGHIQPEGVSAIAGRMMQDEWYRALNNQRRRSERVVGIMADMDTFVARSVEPVFGNMMHEWPESFADTYEKAVCLWERAMDGLSHPRDLTEMQKLDAELSTMVITYIHAEEGDWSFE